MARFPGIRPAGRTRVLPLPCVSTRARRREPLRGSLVHSLLKESSVRGGLEHPRITPLDTRSGPSASPSIRTARRASPLLSVPRGQPRLRPGTIMKTCRLQIRDNPRPGRLPPARRRSTAAGAGEDRQPAVLQSPNSIHASSCETS